MTRIHSILLALFIVSCNPNAPKIEVDEAKEIEAIKNTLTQMWDAIENEDIEKYASFIHPEFTQFGEYDSALRVGKQPEIDGIAGWIADSEGIQTKMIAPRVTIKGNVAWIVYYWSDEGITNGEPFSSQGKSTRIFLKEGESWLCIHGHYTLLP